MDQNKTEVESCPRCGSLDIQAKSFSRGLSMLLQCRQCGITFREPTSLEEDLENAAKVALNGV